MASPNDIMKPELSLLEVIYLMEIGELPYDPEIAFWAFLGGDWSGI